MILCSGEALIDMLPRTTSDQEAAFAPHSGGAVFNTAIALGRLGVTTGFWCGLSQDMFGQQLQGALTASQVDFSLAPLSDRPTTLAFVSLVNGQAKYAFYDENTAARQVSIDDLPELDDSIHAMFFGGISLVSEPCGTVLADFMQRESEHRVTVLDPNIRTGFIKDETAYRQRIQTLLKASDIVKLSDEDADWLLGNGDAKSHGQALLASGVKLAVITEGAKGATAFTTEHQVSVSAPKVTVIDTVGAGDTFNAGLLDGLHTQGCLDKARLSALTKDEMEQALTRAIQIAAVTVSRAGANPPWWVEL